MAANPRTELSQRMMGSAIAMLAVVGVIAYFIYTGKLQPDEPVSFTVTPTQTGTLESGKPIAVDIAVRLENNSKEGLVLNAPTQCDVFRWFLTDKEREFVQAQNDESVCAQVMVSSYLDAQHAMTENFPIALDPQRVKAGEYRLFVRYWGHEMDVPLTIR